MITTLKFKFNLDNRAFSVENAENLCTGLNEMAFSFMSSEEMTSIKHLRFGYEIYKEGRTVLELSFPQPHIKYELVNKSPFEITPFEIEPGVTYKLIGWVELPGKSRLVKDVTVGPLYPPQPYPSWKWNGEDWEAPVPKKFDKPYRWNEEHRKWEEDPDTPEAMFPGYEVE